MNRKLNRELKINDIISTATRLFLRQGYENTTVRQILKEAGISTGSLYHFFSNKEEILLSVFKGISKEVINLSEEIASDFKDPALGNFIAVATEKKAMMDSRRLLNMYRCIWTIPSIQDYILNYRVNHAKRILRSLKKFFKDEDIYIRALASMGIEMALIEANIVSRIKIEPEELWSIHTRMYMSSFGISSRKINEIIQQVLAIMEDKGEQYKKTFINRLTKDIS